MSIEKLNVNKDKKETVKSGVYKETQKRLDSLKADINEHSSESLKDSFNDFIDNLKALMKMFGNIDLKRLMKISSEVTKTIQSPRINFNKGKEVVKKQPKNMPLNERNIEFIVASLGLNFNKLFKGTPKERSFKFNDESLFIALQFTGKKRENVDKDFDFSKISVGDIVVLNGNKPVIISSVGDDIMFKQVKNGTPPIVKDVMLHKDDVTAFYKMNAVVDDGNDNSV